MRKALIIGDTGLIGSAISSELLDRGFDVTGVSRNNADTRWFHVKSAAWNADTLLCSMVKDLDLFFFMLGPDGGKEFKRQNGLWIFDQTIQNIVACSNFLGAKPSCRAVLCSSKLAFQNTLDAFDLYSLSKRAVECFARNSSTPSNDKNITAVRIGNTFGAPDYTGLRFGRLIPTWCAAALANKPLEIYGNVDTEVDLYWHRDVGNFIVEEITSHEELQCVISVPAQLSTPITLSELRLMIQDLCNSRARVAREPYSTFEVKILEVVNWLETHQNYN